MCFLCLKIPTSYSFVVSFWHLWVGAAVNEYMWSLSGLRHCQVILSQGPVSCICWKKTYMIWMQFVTFFQLYIKYMGNFLADIVISQSYNAAMRKSAWALNLYWVVWILLTHLISLAVGYHLMLTIHCRVLVMHLHPNFDNSDRSFLTSFLWFPGSQILPVVVS